MDVFLGVYAAIVAFIIAVLAVVLTLERRQWGWVVVFSLLGLSGIVVTVRQQIVSNRNATERQQLDDQRWARLLKPPIETPLAMTNRSLQIRRLTHGEESRLRVLLLAMAPGTVELFHTANAVSIEVANQFAAVFSDSAWIVKENSVTRKGVQGICICVDASPNAAGAKAAALEGILGDFGLPTMGMAFSPHPRDVISLTIGDQPSNRTWFCPYPL